MADQAGSWNGCLQYAAVSDVGMRRDNNQDAYKLVLASDDSNWSVAGHLFVIADGMGAHAAGELASKIAADGIPHNYQKFLQLSPPEALNEAVRATNSEIHNRGQENIEFHNMGTTASVLVVLPQGAIIGHVGDSRVYRLRGERLDQLTFDHSLVWEMRRHGQLTGGADMSSVIPKNVITRSLGPSPTVEVDVEGPDPVEVGDVFLLCSDGLTGRVADEELGPILASLVPAEAAQMLVDLANVRGGPDNITVIVVKITGERMATPATQTKPLTIGATRSPRRVDPTPWIIAAVGLLAAAVLLLVEQRIAAIVAACVGAIALVVAGTRRLRTTKSGTALGQGLRLGKGPHATAACPVDRKYLDKLAASIEEVRRLSTQNQWHLDYSRVDECESQARAAGEHGDFALAVRHYGRAMNSLRRELKRFARNGDSSIDL